MNPLKPLTLFLSQYPIAFPFLILNVFWISQVVHGQVDAEGETYVNQYLLGGTSQSSFGESQKDKGRARMQLLDRLLTLNEQQKKKLEVAIELDIANYLQEVDSVREKVKDLSPNDNNEWQKFWESVSPLYQRIQAGLFNDESLFQKVSKSILDDEQLAKLLDREKANHRLLIERSAYQAVVRLTSQMPLLAEQQKQLVELMITNIEGKQLNNANVQQEQILPLALIGCLPVDKLPPSFDNSQVTFLKSFRDKYESYGRYFR